MAKRLLENMAAEKEADRIGAQFANSNDVVGDMGKKYNFDFSNVNLHGGEEGANMAESHGDLAYAQGKDAYFGGDLLNKHTPEANMAVGHELTHVMQQNDGAGVSEHVPFGEGQGLGFFRRIGNWFKNLFSRKKKPKAAEPAAATQEEPAQEAAAQEETSMPAGKSPNLTASVRYKAFGEEKPIMWFNSGRDRTSFPRFFSQQIDEGMFGLASQCDDLANVNVDGVKSILDNLVDKLSSYNTINSGLSAPLSTIITEFNGTVDSILPDFQEYSTFVQAMGGNVARARDNYQVLRGMLEQFKVRIREALRERFKNDSRIEE